MRIAGLFKRRDAQIIGALCLLLLLCGGVLFLTRAKAEAGYVNICYGENVDTYPLDQPQSIILDQGSGHVNVVCISPEGVYMESSTCENQICVNQGLVKAGDALTFIVCLPNDVVVELVDASK